MNETTYYANVGLSHCNSCNGESIISIERIEKMEVKRPICSYCGSQYTEVTVRTMDENRKDFHFGPFTLTESK